MSQTNTLNSTPSSAPEGADATTPAVQFDPSINRLIDGFPLPIAVIEIEGAQRVLLLNKQAIRVLGYTLEDIPTVPDWAELAYPDPVYRKTAFERWDAAVARARQHNGQVESLDYVIRCGGGETREVLFSATVLDHLLVVAVTDLTEHNRVEAELREMRDSLQRVAYDVTENMPAGAYSMVMKPGQPMAYFSFMSSRFLEMVGKTREEAEADPVSVFDCVHPDERDEWIRKNQAVFSAKKPFSEQTRLLVKGKHSWVTAESVPRNLPDGSVVWEGVLVDITKLKDTEAALERAYAELIESERLRSRLEERRRLLQDMHDGFGSQLASAQLRLAHETLSQQGVSDLLQECLDDLHLVADALSANQNSLAGAMADYRERLDLRVSAAPLALDWSLDLADCPPIAERSILQVLRIMQEAVGNALKHAQATRLRICATANSSGTLRLEISDNGIGMPAHPKHGRGLDNMLNRAHSLGALLQWKPLHPGTQVVLTTHLVALSQ